MSRHRNRKKKSQPVVKRVYVCAKPACGGAVRKDRCGDDKPNSKSTFGLGKWRCTVCGHRKAVVRLVKPHQD